MKSIFITGTDTGIGKTVVTAAIVKALHHKGMSSIPMKPIQTGGYPTDIDFVLKSANIRISDKVHSLIMPYHFKMPASPHLAAREEGKKINIRKILHSFSVLKKQYSIIVAEGAGGLLVPITKQYFMIDLIKDMNLPVILVARAGLGTLNHTLLSYRALKQAKIPICGIVLNMAKDGKIEKDNLKTLQKLTGCKIIKINFFQTTTSLQKNLISIGTKLINHFSIL